MIATFIRFVLENLPAILFVSALAIAALRRGHGLASERFLAWILLLPGIFQYTYLGPTFGVIQNAVDTRRRATATAVHTRWARSDRRRSIRTASAASVGLPSTSSPTTTTVSAATTIRPGCRPTVACAFSTAIRRT